MSRGKSNHAKPQKAKENKMEKLVITRHAALVDFLIEKGIIEEGNFRLISHASAEDVKGQEVIGILPLELAALAKSITTVPLNVPMEKRGQELSIEDIRQFAGSIKTFVVSEIA